MKDHERLQIIADQDYRKTLADMELLHRDLEFALDKLSEVEVGLIALLERLRTRLGNISGG